MDDDDEEDLEEHGARAAIAAFGDDDAPPPSRRGRASGRRRPPARAAAAARRSGRAGRSPSPDASTAAVPAAAVPAAAPVAIASDQCGPDAAALVAARMAAAGCDDLEASLYVHFGHTAFKGGDFQRHADQAVRGERDALVVAPTGGGKSLCYQLPALMLDGAKGRFAIVVSPLQALMRERVEELNEGARRGRTSDVAASSASTQT